MEATTDKIMKKLILFLLALLFVMPMHAQTRTDKDDNTVYHPFFAVVQYQMGTFDMPKQSSGYGLGMYATSISHWGRFHVGANLDFSINAGIIDDWGCIISFGPSARIDITKHLFVNVPVDAMCSVTFPEGTTDTKTTWGGKIAPSIHAFISERFGLFAGPSVSFGSGDPGFGMQAGLSYSF